MMINTVISEPANFSDIKPMAELLYKLLAQEADFTPDMKLQEEGLRLILEHSEIGQLLVLKENNKIVGMINLLFSISTALGGKVAIFEDLIVDKNFRNKGYGGQLLKDAIAYAKKENCLRITLLTDTDNEIAHKFYQKHGFVKSGMVPFRLTFAN